PYGMMFGEITASSLVKVDLDGNIVGETEYQVNPAGFTIHSAVHAVREDVKCVLHLHTNAGVAVSAQKQGLLPISQTALILYNDVKIALLEKGIPFEEERHTTGKDSIDAGSPLGKVPFLRTPQGVLCESQAIIEYIEETQPQPALWPRDAFQRAKCRELIDFI